MMQIARKSTLQLQTLACRSSAIVIDKFLLNFLSTSTKQFCTTPWEDWKNVTDYRLTCHVYINVTSLHHYFECHVNLQTCEVLTSLLWVPRQSPNVRGAYVCLHIHLTRTAKDGCDNDNESRWEYDDRSNRNIKSKRAGARRPTKWRWGESTS